MLVIVRIARVAAAPQYFLTLIKTLRYLSLIEYKHGCVALHNEKKLERKVVQNSGESFRYINERRFTEICPKSALY
ncbi:hypothetical protein IFVP22_C230253 [Vibrio parahaemolyticus]